MLQPGPLVAHCLWQVLGMLLKEGEGLDLAGLPTPSVRVCFKQRDQQQLALPKSMAPALAMILDTFDKYRSRADSFQNAYVDLPGFELLTGNCCSWLGLLPVAIHLPR